MFGGTCSAPKQKWHHGPKPLLRQLLSCFSRLLSRLSLILIQYTHVFVCEEVQKRNVADGLVNVTHCNFFGNPGPKYKGCHQMLFLSFP